MRSRPQIVAMLALSLLAPMVLGTSGNACPFCSSVSQTLSEEMASVDVVVVAELVKLGKPATEDDEEVPKATFKIVEVLSGKKYVGNTKEFQTLYFGEAKKGQRFMVTAVDPPGLVWSTPLEVTTDAVGYLKTLPELPKEGKKRLAHFVKYLENKDEMLARDAYDEFARAPYDLVKQIKAQLPHDKIVNWMTDVDIPASRRRLYFTLLGVCGNEKDLPLLEELLRSTDRKTKAGLDAMAACYLTLKGDAGLPLIEDLFLRDKDSDYADTYAVIMALRFHGTEGQVLDRKRILKSLHLMLDRPQLADLVIPDLSRWEDWSQIDKLVKLFKTADEKTSWVRVPVINYLRRCPLPAAKKHIKELEKIDPSAVKRANTFFPFGGGGVPAAPNPDKTGPGTGTSTGTTPGNETGDKIGNVNHQMDQLETQVAVGYEPNQAVVWAVPLVVGLGLLGASFYMGN